MVTSKDKTTKPSSAATDELVDLSKEQVNIVTDFLAISCLIFYLDHGLPTTVYLDRALISYRVVNYSI